MLPLICTFFPLQDFGTMNVEWSIKVVALEGLLFIAIGFVGIVFSPVFNGLYLTRAYLGFSHLISNVTSFVLTSVG